MKKHNGLRRKLERYGDASYVVAYFESDVHAEIVAIFPSEDKYDLFWEVLETEAKKIGMKLTETTGLTWEEVQERIKG